MQCADPDKVSREHRGHRAEHKRNEKGATAEHRFLDLDRCRKPWPQHSADDLDRSPSRATSGPVRAEAVSPDGSTIAWVRPADCPRIFTRSVKRACAC